MPMEVILDSVVISTTIRAVLEKWKNKHLFVNKTNCSSFVPDVGDTSISFNEHMPELVKAVDHAKRQNARWADSIKKF